MARKPSLFWLFFLNALAMAAGLAVIGSLLLFG